MSDTCSTENMQDILDGQRATHCETRCSRTASREGSFATTVASTCSAGNLKVSNTHSRVRLQSMLALEPDRHRQQGCCTPCCKATLWFNTHLQWQRARFGNCAATAPHLCLVSQRVCAAAAPLSFLIRASSRQQMGGLVRTRLTAEHSGACQLLLCKQGTVFKRVFEMTEGQPRFRPAAAGQALYTAGE